jgi:TolB protein
MKSFVTRMRLPLGALPLVACLWWPVPDARAQRSAIFAMNADGTDIAKISHQDDWWLGSAAWSHDGKKLAYVGTEQRNNSGSLRILVESFDEQKPTILGPGDGPSWSPDDGQIVFFLDAANKFSEKPGIWIMNADGTGREWLCEGTRPRWSPDGDRIAHVSNHEGFQSIYVFDTVSLERTRILARGYYYLVGASWSPDGKQVVYVGYKNGQPFQGGQGELAVADVSSDATPQVLATGVVGWHPDWSPDGKQIVFWFYTNRQERLHLLEVGSKEAPRLLPGQFTPRNSDPAWSPDSKRIAFSSDRDPN